MKRFVSSMIAVALTLLLSIPAGSQDINSQVKTQKDKLNQIQREIERHRSESAKLKRQEKDVAKQLELLDKEIRLANDLITGLDTQERLLEEQIDSLRANIAVEGVTLELQKTRLGNRLRQMYKQGRHHEWEVLLAGADMQDVIRRSKFLGLVAERDAHLVNAVSDRKTSLEVEQAMLTEAMADIVNLKSQRTDESVRLAQNKNYRVSMLKEIRAETSAHDNAIDDLKARQEKLKDLIAALESKRLNEPNMGELPTGDFAALKGKLMYPVEGKVINKFGENRHPEFGTVTFNSGIDIQAPAGTPIRAVAEGRCEFVDWISGYGNCVILNHGKGYYTLYAHAAQIFIQPGQTAFAGDVIGEVGDSGSLNGYICHFEVRKAKTALDPHKWLRK